MSIKSNQSSDKNAKDIEAMDLVQVKMLDKCKHTHKSSTTIGRAKVLIRIVVICMFFIAVIAVTTSRTSGNLYEIKLCIQKIFCGHNSEGSIIGDTCFGIEIVHRRHYRRDCNDDEVTVETRRIENDNNTVPSVCLSNKILLLLNKYQNTTCYDFSFYSHNYTATSTQTTLCFIYDERNYISHLDDVSVTDTKGNNRNQLCNGGFEKTWGRYAWRTESGFITISSFGRLAGSYSYYHDDYYYRGYRYLWQTFPTVPGHTYNISLYFAAGNSVVRQFPVKVLVGN